MELPPIVERMYELNVWLLNKVGKFPRDQRFILGQRITDKGLDIQEGLIRAALSRNSEAKSESLREANVQLAQLRYLIRLGKDGRCMNVKAWHFCSKNLLEIGRMLGGWIKTV